MAAPSSSGGSGPVYDGTTRRARAVIWVSINYRLGRIGFFATRRWAGRTPDEPQGNYG